MTNAVSTSKVYSNRSKGATFAVVRADPWKDHKYIPKAINGTNLADNIITLGVSSENLIIHNPEKTLQSVTPRSPVQSLDERVKPIGAERPLPARPLEGGHEWLKSNSLSRSIVSFLSPERRTARVQY